MKKLFLLLSAVALTISLNSCSSSSVSGSSGTLSFKVNGIQKNFKATPEEDTGFLFVDGYIGNPDNPTEAVQFNMPLESGSTINIIESFIYSNPNEVDGATTILSNVTSQTANSIKGTFSATINNNSGGTPDLTITEGKFSFSY